MKAKTKPTSKTRSQTNKPRAEGKPVDRIVVNLGSLEGAGLRQMLVDRLTQDLRGNKVESEMPARSENLSQGQLCCEATAPVDPKLIPSLVESLHRELTAVRETVCFLSDRLAPVLAAPKKDAGGVLGYASGDGAPSLANDLGMLGSGFYNERRKLEDVIARLQL